MVPSLAPTFDVAAAAASKVLCRFGNLCSGLGTEGQFHPSTG